MNQKRQRINEEPWNRYGRGPLNHANPLLWWSFSSNKGNCLRYLLVKVRTQTLLWLIFFFFFPFLSTKKTRLMIEFLRRGSGRVGILPSRLRSQGREISETDLRFSPFRFGLQRSYQDQPCLVRLSLNVHENEERFSEAVRLFPQNSRFVPVSRNRERPICDTRFVRGTVEHVGK